MNKKEIHDLRNELTKVNKTLLLAREYSTQPTVLNYLNQAVVQICSIGDKLKGE